MGQQVSAVLNQAAEETEDARISFSREDLDKLPELPSYGRRAPQPKSGARSRRRSEVPASAADAEDVWGDIDTTKVDVGRLAPRILEAQRHIPVVEARVMHTLRNAHDCYVRVLVWDPFRDLLISGGGDGWIRIWNTQTFAFEQELDAQLSVRSVLVLTQELASGHSNGEVMLWDMEGPGRPKIETLRAHREAVYALAMLRSGELVTGAEDIRVFARDGRGRFALVCTVAEEVLCMCTVPGGVGGTQIITGNMNGLVTVWDTAGDWDVAAHCRGHSRSIWAICYVRDAKMCASGSADHTLRIWNPQNWQCVNILRDHTGWVVGLSSGPGWLLSCSIDQTARAWDVRRWTCARVFDDQRYEVYCVCAFAGGRFATGGAEMSIVVYGANEASDGPVWTGGVSEQDQVWNQQDKSDRQRRQDLIAQSSLDMTMSGMRDMIDRQFHGGAPPTGGQGRDGQPGSVRRGGGRPPADRSVSPLASRRAPGMPATPPRSASPGGVLGGIGEALGSVARALSPRRQGQEEVDLDFDTAKAVPRTSAAAAAAARASAEAASQGTAGFGGSDSPAPRQQCSPPPRPPAPAFAAGGRAQVFSATLNRWLLARVTKVDGGMVTVVYNFPDGGEATKALPSDHQHIRPADEGAPPESPPPGAVAFGHQRTVKSKATYVTGGEAEVYSSTQDRWVRAKTTKVENGQVTVIYKFPDGGEGTKQLPIDHQHLRPVQEDSPAGSSPGGVQEWSPSTLRK